MRYRIIALLLLLCPALALSGITGWENSALIPLALILLFYLLIHIKRRLIRPRPDGYLDENTVTVKSGDMNFYLFRNQLGWFAVDSGYQSSSTAGKLEALGIRPETVHTVFLTHSDYDHTGGLEIFSSAVVYMHGEEKPLVNRQQARLFFLYRVPGLERDIRWFTGREWDLPLKPVFLPGHTRGHCGYLVNNRYLCTGDAIRFTRKGLRPFFRFLCMNPGRAKESAAKISRCADNLILCTGHSGVYQKQEGRFKALPQ